MCVVLKKRAQLYVSFITVRKALYSRGTDMCAKHSAHERGAVLHGQLLRFKVESRQSPNSQRTDFQVTGYLFKVHGRQSNSVTNRIHRDSEVCLWILKNLSEAFTSL